MEQRGRGTALPTIQQTRPYQLIPTAASRSRWKTSSLIATSQPRNPSIPSIYRCSIETDLRPGRAGSFSISCRSQPAQSGCDAFRTQTSPPPFHANVKASTNQRACCYLRRRWLGAALPHPKPFSRVWR